MPCAVGKAAFVDILEWLFMFLVLHFHFRPYSHRASRSITSMLNKFALGHLPGDAREKIFWLLLPDNRVLQSSDNHVVNRLFVEASGAFSLPTASTALGSSVSL